MAFSKQLVIFSKTDVSLHRLKKNELITSVKSCLFEMRIELISFFDIIEGIIIKKKYLFHEKN